MVVFTIRLLMGKHCEVPMLKYDGIMAGVVICICGVVCFGGLCSV